MASRMNSFSSFGFTKLALCVIKKEYKKMLDNEDVSNDTIVKWYCTERLVKSFRNLPKDVSEQVSLHLASLAMLMKSRGIRISDIDFSSHSCGYTVGNVFFVLEW